MYDLVMWFREQLDLDRAHAEKDLWILDRATAAGDWRQHAGFNMPSEVRAGDLMVARVETTAHDADSMLIARLAKRARSMAERVLVDVDAKRRILDRYVELMEEVEDAERRGDWDAAPAATAFAYEQVTRTLALPCADRPGYRPGYRPEWRP